MKNLFLYSIVSLIVYVNIKNYLINKNKFIRDYLIQSVGSIKR